MTAAKEETPAFVWPDGISKDAIPLVLTMPKDRAAMRLDRYLVVVMPRLSRTRAAKIAERFAFATDGRALRPSKLLRPGDTVVLFRPTDDEPEAPRNVGVLYEDPYLLAVDKPAGLAVHPTAKQYRNTLTWILSELFPKQKTALCHRLDKETSGVLLVARTDAAEVQLKNAFASRDVHKTYLAIVHGEVLQEQFVIDAPLALAGGELSVLMCVKPEAEGGLPSRTRITVLERLKGFTVVEAEPETGRQHQIRLHLAHAGHAIVGDKLYAHGVEPFLRSHRDGMTEELRALLLLDRHALHARRVRFAHPAEDRECTIEAPVPLDMAEFIASRR